MGQYWKAVNLDKKEFIHPHKLGSGLKLWEILANPPGVGAALIILTACMPEARGGGDFDLDENWHGPERDEAMKSGQIDGCTPGPMPEDYSTIATRTIGRWAGDRITLVGDYSEDEDMPNSPVQFSEIYGKCPYSEEDKKEDSWTDVTDDVCRVIEHELGGKFEGDGWRTWKETNQ